MHPVGLETAKVLKDKFGTPYVIGTPVGDFTEDLVMALEQVTKNTEKKLSEEESASVGQDEPEIPYASRIVCLNHRKSR